MFLCAGAVEEEDLEYGTAATALRLLDNRPDDDNCVFVSECVCVCVSSPQET